MDFFTLSRSTALNAYYSIRATHKMDMHSVSRLLSSFKSSKMHTCFCAQIIAGVLLVANSPRNAGRLR